MQVDDRPIVSRRGRSWGWSPLLTAWLLLCAFSTDALAEQVDVSTALDGAGFRIATELDEAGLLGKQFKKELSKPVPRFPPEEVFLPIQPCSRMRGDEELLSAIYLDLDVPLASERFRREQWFCADFDPLGIDLISLDPSSLTVILESDAGEIWEIGFARLDGSPLEPAAFASDAAGFFINLVEWNEDGELAVLDADFEVELADGDSLWGRVLWNAPWTPDEASFVPLTGDDWENAWPGEVSIEGPALDRLFRATRLPNFTAVTPGERLDSIRYSREPAKDPEAAQKEVAKDLALLPGSPPTDAASTTRGSIPWVAISAAAARSSAAGSAGRGSAAAAYLPVSATSTAQTRHIPTPDSRAWPDQETSEFTPDSMPDGIVDREPWWLDDPVPSEEPAAQRSGAQACSPGDGARRGHAGASDDSLPGCLTEAVPSEGAAGRGGSDPREARSERGGTDRAEEARKVATSEDHARRTAPGDRMGSGSAAADPPALQAWNRAGAVGRGNEADGSVSLERLFEEYWLALRTNATRWLQAISMLGTQP